MKRKIFRPIVTGALITALLIVFLNIPKVSATSLSYNLSITASCAALIDGASSTTASVQNNQSSNVTVENTDNVVSLSVSGANIPGGTTLGPNNKTSSGIQTFQLGTVTSQEVITFTPIPNSTNPYPNGNNCPTGSNPTSSQLIINPIASSQPASTSTSTSTLSTSKSAASSTTGTNNPTMPAAPTLTGIQINGKSVSTNAKFSINQDQSLKLSGQTIANGVITLTIHSAPKTATVTADSNGNWSYTVTGLAVGTHYIQAYVTNSNKQNSQDNTILNFSVNSNPVVIKMADTKNRSPYMIAAYILLLVLILTLIFIIVWKRKSLLNRFRKSTPKSHIKKDTNEPQDDVNNSAGSDVDK